MERALDWESKGHSSSHNSDMTDNVDWGKSPASWGLSFPTLHKGWLDMGLFLLQHCLPLILKLY
jgi:hypothetical protein